MSEQFTPPTNDPNDQGSSKEIERLVGNIQLFVMTNGEQISKSQSQEYIEHILDTHLGPDALVFPAESIADNETIGKIVLMRKKYNNLDLKVELFIPDEKLITDENKDTLLLYAYFKIVRANTNESLSFLDDMVITGKFDIHNAVEAEVVNCLDSELTDMDRILDDLGYSRDSSDHGSDENGKEYSLSGSLSHKQYLDLVVAAISDERLGLDWHIEKRVIE